MLWERDFCCLKLISTLFFVISVIIRINVKLKWLPHPKIHHNTPSLFCWRGDTEKTTQTASRLQLKHYKYSSCLNFNFPFTPLLFTVHLNTTHTTPLLSQTITTPSFISSFSRCLVKRKTAHLASEGQVWNDDDALAAPPVSWKSKCSIWGPKYRPGKKMFRRGTSRGVGCRAATQAVCQRI